MGFINTSDFARNATMNTNFLDWSSASVGCGLILHVIYNRYEPRALLAHLLLLLVLPLLVSILLSHASPFNSFYAYTICLATLSISTISYRLSPFHPLAKYPGPLIARISKLWMLRIVRSGKKYIYFKELHDQYGPYVRIGPNELSCCDVDAINPLLGTDGLSKSPKWEARMVPNPAIPHVLIALRNQEEHATRRRRWSKAFTTASIKEYHPSILKRARQLVNLLAKESSQTGVTNVTKCISCFTFDFMGDMVFSGGFELMSNPEHHEFMHLMHKNFEDTFQIEQLPWASRLAFKIPSIAKDILRYKFWAMSKAKERYDFKEAGRDLFSHLIDESDLLPADRKPTLGQITTDASLAIAAGADTTSSAMTSALYFLSKNPAELKRLREEVDALFADGDEDTVLFDTQKLADMKFLNAVLNETIRLLPPIPTGADREAYPGTGTKVFGEHVIPEGNSVILPPYVLHRDPRYFSPLPDRFWPERWIIAEEGCNSADPSAIANGGTDEKNQFDSKVDPSSPRLKITHNTAAFIPFSYGPRNCVGMRLAMLEMRITLSLLVRKFDFAPAPATGEEGDVDLYEEGSKDMFAFHVAKLNLKLTPRVEAV